MSVLQPLPKILKQDLFGRVELIYFNDSSPTPQLAIRRDIGAAKWWVKLVAIYLARREIGALNQLERQSVALDQFPRILQRSSNRVVRSYIPGQPLHLHGAPPQHFFAELKVLLAKMHAAGVAHNDLAKEPNVLVTPNGQPAIIDMQLASRSVFNTRFFRMQCREDYRHLLKHQRTYHPETLTPQELSLLENKALPAKLWMLFVKPTYLFVTRRIFKWSDREGAGDRNAN
jgi:RIO-like serine/threonine protein kinase